MSVMSPRLRRIRLRVRVWRSLAIGCFIAALAGMLWSALGFLDLRFAFEPGTRQVLTWALAGAISLLALWWGLRWLAMPARETAALVDAASGDPRRPVEAGLSLGIQQDHETPLARWLREQAKEESEAAIIGVSQQKLVPWRGLAVGLACLLVPICGWMLARALAPEPWQVISQRWLHPTSDLAPYTPLKFAVAPTALHSVYGGDLELAATVSGGRVDMPVMCLVRRPGKSEVISLPTFRATAGRFTRTLEGITEEIEVAFGCGRARSAWQRVDLLMEPEILAGVVRIEAPSYSRREAQEFPLDRTELSALEGSRIRLTLTSNRPLGSAEIIFTPSAPPGESPPTARIEGTVTAANEASFEWEALRSGRLSAELRDLRGTPSKKPLEITLRCVADLPPAVQLLSPPPRMFATPSSKIPVRGRAEDDLALARVQISRTLAGFRDRVRVVAPALDSREHEFSETLDLRELGVRPGEVIEMTLDASDHHPSQLGYGSSPISRIEVISEETFAAYVRARTTTAEFSARFQAADEAMENARQALEESRAAAFAGDDQALAEALEKAAAAHRAAADLLERIADDFPAFELEKRLQDLARGHAQELRKNLEQLENLPMQPQERDAAIEEMLGRLEQRQELGAPLQQDLHDLADLNRLLEMAARMRGIYETQASLTKRLAGIAEEIRRGNDQNRRQLPLLGETQEKNRAALRELQLELERRAEAADPLNPMTLPMIDSAKDFLAALDQAAPGSLMGEAAARAKAGEGAEAATQAELARALLLRLLMEPEPFPEAVMGKAPQLDAPPDVNDTIEQLLDGLMRRNLPNQGGPQGHLGLGGQQGNGGASGYLMDMPVLGPDRMQFDPAQPPRPGENGSQGGTPVPEPLPQTAETDVLPDTGKRASDRSFVTPDEVPESYRDAVKRYFTP